MCCHANKQAKEDFLAEMKKKRRKTFTAWKVLHSEGLAYIIYDYHYSPGIHRVEVTEDTYSTRKPRGIHVFMNKEFAIKYGNRSSATSLIPVQCHVDDLVVMGGDSWHYGFNSQEAVLSKVKITKKDWKEAKLPIKKG